ncbi:ComEC/Rec2 family competence protein [Paenibacillus protaetiae]|uniref:ComEC/Rec2 family competence protein n=1 Tax=Paenibacillus protaetiae TaxID=2509456 RepID=UPI0013EC94AD|nr:MBL fold metallo-hydrolase [Paenibacillus protaetiae]
MITLQATVNFINVGWGDAQLIRLPSGAATLIDGGDGAIGPERDHPLTWMDRHGVSRLDWMILTHIHEDHLNGLLDIARRCEVKRAVLPYALPMLPQSLKAWIMAEGRHLAARVYGLLEAYSELIRLLHEQGTDVHWRSEYGGPSGQAVWAEDGYTLAHLYPWQEDPLPGLGLLHDAAQNAAAEPEAASAALERFFSLSNDDSSVYRLVHAEDPSGGILLGGDQLIPGWERIAKRTELRSRVWKVPHHGLEDGFQAAQLSEIRPEICVITVCKERAMPQQERWDKLHAESGAAIHLTGSVKAGERVPLTDGPIGTWIGG